MSGRCLIVEDDVMFVEIFQRILRRFTCDGPVARTAAEAIVALKKHDFDVVLLDLRLAGSDGGTVLEFVRRSKPHMLGCIIAVTNYPVMARALAPDVPLIDKGNLTALPERLNMLLGKRQ